MQNKPIRKKRRGFSLVELVIVIIIVAVLTTAVFVGGDKVVKKSKTSRTISDMHNFSVAAETTLNELPTVVNIANNSMGDGSIMKTAVEKFNNSLGAPFKLESTTPLSDTAVGNIQVTASTAGSYAVFQSKRTDAWSNPFFVIFDCAEREEGPTEFYITVISAGPNSVANVGGQIESDDIFMIAEYSNSQVRSMTFNAKEIATMTHKGVTLRINSDDDTYPVARYSSNTLTNNTSTLMPVVRGTVDTNASGTAPAAAPATPTLSTPTTSLSGDTLTITAVANATSYKVYSNGTLLTTVNSTTVNLASLLSTPGTYSITVRATATGYTDSSASSSVSYTVTSGYAITTTAPINYPGASGVEFYMRIDGGAEEFISYAIPGTSLGSGTSTVAFRSYCPDPWVCNITYQMSGTTNTISPTWDEVVITLTGDLVITNVEAYSY